jgi:hypothetical protein
MKTAGRMVSALLFGVLAFHPGLLPQPTALDANTVQVAAPVRSKAAPAKSGAGRIGGPAKKDGVVNGTGRRAAGSHIGGK